jgi:hypothetical protein
MSPCDMSACLAISLHAHSIRTTGYHRFWPELIPIPKSIDVLRLEFWVRIQSLTQEIEINTLKKL